MRTMLEVEEALRLITDRVRPLAAESVPAQEAHGRVLAKDVYAPISQPPWPRSPLDGYALHAADTKGAGRDTPVTLAVVDKVYAGGVPSVPVRPGEAARIMTGAPIPDGCDCVLRQEDTDLGAERVTIFSEVEPYQNYCPAGEDFCEGDVLLRRGTRLNGSACGVLASAGLLRKEVLLPVVRQVRCALFCTGDELVTNDTAALLPGKIYSSNAAMLAARLTELGVLVVRLAEAFPDDAQALAEAIRQAEEEADLILTVGGVSVGEKDILHETLPLLGADRILWKARVKPGSPLMFSIHEKPILSLSGNPFAAGATFELFGRAVLAGLAGCGDLLPVRTEGILDTPFEKGGGMRRIVRGFFADGRVTLPEGHASGQLASSAGMNCLVDIPAEKGPLAAGSRVDVWLL